VILALAKIILIGCHPEPVEGSRVKAIARMLRQAQHDTHLFIDIALNVLLFFESCLS